MLTPREQEILSLLWTVAIDNIEAKRKAKSESQESDFVEDSDVEVKENSFQVD